MEFICEKHSCSAANVYIRVSRDESLSEERCGHQCSVL